MRTRWKVVFVVVIAVLLMAGLTTALVWAATYYRGAAFLMPPILAMDVLHMLVILCGGFLTGMFVIALGIEIKEGMK